MNIGILFANFGPYHVARIEALGNKVNSNTVNLIAFRFSETSKTYSWKPSSPKGVEVITLGTRSPKGIIEAIKISYSFTKALNEKKVKVIFLPSYSPLPNALCVLFAKLTGCKIILMNESWKMTEKAGKVGRFVKHLFVRLFNAALVGGSPQAEYARQYGLNSEKIFLGYDAVNVSYYSEEARRWKGIPFNKLPVPNLPKRYFLNLGRFVSKKNLASLIRAYAQLIFEDPSAGIALVLVGEGAEENNLKELAISLSLKVRNGLEEKPPIGNEQEVVFYPFQQVEITPLFFSLCEAFILPSIYEEWGLVVNEAMACGAAVLVSENVGCSYDLVLNGENGFKFDPYNHHQLSQQMKLFLTDPNLAGRMGASGAKQIINWGPDRFAEGALSAIKAATVE